MGIVIEKIELLALRKLVVVSMAVAQQLTPSAKQEQIALARVLNDVIMRAEIDAVTSPTPPEREKGR